MLNPINLLFPRQDKTIASHVQFLVQERKKNFYTPRVYTATERKKKFLSYSKNCTSDAMVLSCRGNKRFMGLST